MAVAAHERKRQAPKRRGVEVVPETQPLAAQPLAALPARPLAADYLQVASARTLANWYAPPTKTPCASLQDALERGPFLRNEHVSIVVDYWQLTSL